MEGRGEVKKRGRKLKRDNVGGTGCVRRTVVGERGGWMERVVVRGRKERVWREEGGWREGMKIDGG